MQITITVNDKAIAKQVGYMVENEVTENFSVEVLKAVGVKEKELVKACLADEKFMAKYTKMITKYAQSCMDDDILYDAICDIDGPKVLADTVKECHKMYDSVDEAERIKEKAKEVKEAVAVLEAAGFKVTKG